MNCERCEEIEKALKVAIHRLYNQGVPSSDFMHRANMDAAAAGEAALALPHHHPLPASVSEALNSGDGSYRP